MAGFDFLSIIQSETARFRDVLRNADPAAPVPTCPEWSAADLLWHLTEVQWFWGTIVVDRLTSPESAEAATPPRPSDHRELVALSTTACDRLLDALRDCPADAPTWSWYPPDQTAGFSWRRQAHEALIHRIDAELTAGGPVGSVDPTLCVDGISEVFEMFLGWTPEWGSHDLDGPLGRVTATDTGDEWTVRIGHFRGTSPTSGTVYDEATVVLVDPTAAGEAKGEANGKTVGEAKGTITGEATEPDFTVAASAVDLNRWLWSRHPDRAPQLTGNTAEFLAVVARGMQ